MEFEVRKVSENEVNKTWNICEVTVVYVDSDEKITKICVGQKTG